MQYDFLGPAKIVFGWGRRQEIGRVARELGGRAFIVWGSRSLATEGRTVEISEALRLEGVEPITLGSISREPEVADVDQMSALLRAANAAAGDMVLGVGGGSAIDLAKAVAAMATQKTGWTVKDYLEGVGSGLQITEAPLAILAMPTTAGTGSEATKNAVISSYDPPFKKSLRSPLMVPRAVLIDPELCVSVPATTTAHTGMDALTQLIESYISRRASPIPQALALQGLKLGAPALAEAVRNGGSPSAREAMSHAALLSGMALANSGLGMAHGVAGALGVHCRIAHGLACAVMLPVALRVNRAVCQRQYAELAAAIGASASMEESRAADALVRFIDELCTAIGIPRHMSDIGVQAPQIPELVRSSRGNSMDGNPRTIDDAELRQILEGLL